MPDKIAVIDFGGQYAHLIATKVREAGVYAEILEPDHDVELLRSYKGLILSGSPALSSQDEFAMNGDIFTGGVPILGFCFGHQEIAKFHGGKIEHKGQEYGRSVLRITAESPLFEGLSKEETVWMSHGDAVVSPGDMEEIGVSVSPDGKIQRYSALQHMPLKHFGLQFHPEVDDTPNGKKMIENFVLKICSCRKSWTQKTILDTIENSLGKNTLHKKVVMLVSGGVDSTVAAVLLGKFLPSENLHFIHIDTGLMRENESAEVISLFERQGLLNSMEFIDASRKFLSKLEGISDPEEKRKIIGDTFVEVSQDLIENSSEDESFVLGQGTIYPDRIETGGSKHANRIKTHHNRVPLIEEMIKEGRVVEPIKDLYKKEVRDLGSNLGIPSEFLKRHPFPGPGLGVRCVCSDGLVENNEFEKVKKSLATIHRGAFKLGAIPIKSVGVKGDLRSYEFTAAVCSEKYDLSEGSIFANVVFRFAKGVNRVLWMFGLKELPEFKPRRAYITPDRLQLLRKADKKANDLLLKHRVYEEIWQMPVIMLPVKVNGLDAEIIVLRPVRSERGMTARPYFLSENFMREMDVSLKETGSHLLAFDLSSKPPATIEWE